jgi:hypothetical protein
LASLDWLASHVLRYSLPLFEFFVFILIRCTIPTYVSSFKSRDIKASDIPIAPSRTMLVIPPEPFE